MKERPILFSGAMIRAIFENKVQTRRVLKPQPKSNLGLLRSVDGAYWSDRGRIVRCLYGAPGDRLWVRETWALEDCGEDGKRIIWAADRAAAWVEAPKTLGEVYYLPSDYDPRPFKPSIHMPRWASRITLEVTEVRVQRLQDISEEDALAEGVEASVDRIDGHYSVTAREQFEVLWESINGERKGCAWKDNPWVWAVSFKVVR